ncbi:MAG: type I-C CRISPR-associated protein Cas8c/Csd1 [Negativicutes bacterium]|nr:type I-C CRISPR-associated protein Cas8c/Csd1 [Negativicutes bacterium]
MSWIQKLYETYENSKGIVGKSFNEDEVALLPICHTTNKAQIEIVIDGLGNFQRAMVVPKEQSKTIIPCTEQSGGRSGKKPENHPLCDKLQYLAADFSSFGGIVTVGYANNPNEPYEKYTDLLTRWCQSDFSHPKARAVLEYVRRGNVIKDLVENRILVVGEDNKLLEKWKEKSRKNIPEIFLVTTNSMQGEAFVRWIVEIPGEPHTKVWTDETLFKSWIGFYSATKKTRSLCYISGKDEFIAEQHPSKVRNDGDKAKLISSNDTSGFTFRGRFITANQACSVGFEVTQKAHNALRWLINRQGYRKGDLVIVAWASNGGEIPDPLADTFILLNLANEEDNLNCAPQTAQELAVKLKRKIEGYKRELGNTNNIVVMGLDAATPGRMAIIFYRELTGSEFLRRIEKWHTSCVWMHDCKGVGAPSPNDIADAVCGIKSDEKLKKSIVSRIIPCIIDGKPIPKDIVYSAVNRASNRCGLENGDWNKTLSIACALYRKYSEKENFEMPLDKERKTRDYLYGRLLAVAERLEEGALRRTGEKRPTNAARYMQQFASRPYKTWMQIEVALTPYILRLGSRASWYKKMMDEIMESFDIEDYVSDKPLSGEYLLGYHCQRDEFRKKWEEKASELEPRE